MDDPAAARQVPATCSNQEKIHAFNALLILKSVMRDTTEKDLDRICCSIFPGASGHKFDTFPAVQTAGFLMDTFLKLSLFFDEAVIAANMPTLGKLEVIDTNNGGINHRLSPTLRSTNVSSALSHSPCCH